MAAAELSTSRDDPIALLVLMDWDCPGDLAGLGFTQPR